MEEIHFKRGLQSGKDYFCQNVFKLQHYHKKYKKHKTVCYAQKEIIAIRDSILESDTGTVLPSHL
jgi:hypothetical protein